MHGLESRLSGYPNTNSIGCPSNRSHRDCPTDIGICVRLRYLKRGRVASETGMPIMRLENPDAKNPVNLNRVFLDSGRTLSRRAPTIDHWFNFGLYLTVRFRIFLISWGYYTKGKIDWLIITQFQNIN